MSINKKLVAIYLIVFLIIVGIGLIFAQIGHNYDVDKCNSVVDNEYYYTDNDCFTVINYPNLNLFEWFFVSTVIFGTIWLFSLIIQWTEGDFEEW